MICQDPQQFASGPWGWEVDSLGTTDLESLGCTVLYQEQPHNNINSRRTACRELVAMSQQQNFPALSKPEHFPDIAQLTCIWSYFNSVFETAFLNVIAYFINLHHALFL